MVCEIKGKKACHLVDTVFEYGLKINLGACVSLRRVCKCKYVVVGTHVASYSLSLSTCPLISPTSSSSSSFPQTQPHSFPPDLMLENERGGDMHLWWYLCIAMARPNNFTNVILTKQNQCCNTVRTVQCLKFIESAVIYCTRNVAFYWKIVCIYILTLLCLIGYFIYSYSFFSFLLLHSPRKYSYPLESEFQPEWEKEEEEEEEKKILLFLPGKNMFAFS